MGVRDTEYSDKPCWMREYCICRTAACLCSQPEDDGCPVYMEFKNIFKKQGLLIEEKGEDKSMITAEEAMITAQEARNQSDEILKEKQLKVIEGKIRKSINNGGTSVSIDYLSDCTQAALTNLGYKVKFHPGIDCRDSDYWTVSWD